MWGKWVNFDMQSKKITFIQRNSRLGATIVQTYTHVIRHVSRIQSTVMLTHLPLVPHICISVSVSIGSDNGLPPIRHQAII